MICCPRCTETLDGGPVVYRCARCERTVWAADLDTEYRAPARPVVEVSGGVR